MKRIALVNFTTLDYTIEETILRNAGCQVEVYDGVATEDLPGTVRDAEVLVVQLQQVPEALLDAMPSLKLIAREGIGLDSIPLQAATARWITVMNVPDYCLEEVAVHAVSLMLAAHRKLFAASSLAREGQWTRMPELKPIYALSALTVGLIGMGRIGAQVIARLKGFGCRMIVSDPYLRPDGVPEGVELVSLDDLLAQSDLISLHCPYTEETKHLINKARIAQMKKQPVLINVSRGPLVHEGDLVDALNAGAISFAGLDVLTVEPPAYDHPLLHHPQAIVTNHIAWYSEQSEARLRNLTSERIVAFLEGREIPNVVNGG
ncbi:C-terminal binding protein [Paenibacillus glycinis]|uniref:C-terminal binding protein n=1 Tax=Paenibacillus glycinis TaxID=2697035 RepID=A0ABW9XT02_9BACL|nr:C-terminal binding protein [Paenibacillus glycinis]NBD25608.1 C-terminal binding protein [Paenibacillus glycinis]